MQLDVGPPRQRAVLAVLLLLIAEFYGGAISFDEAQIADVLQQWQRWTVYLPESVNASHCVHQLPALPGVPEPLAGLDDGRGALRGRGGRQRGAAGAAADA